jgi:hypothetical protein
MQGETFVCSEQSKVIFWVKLGLTFDGQSNNLDTQTHSSQKTMNKRFILSLLASPTIFTSLMSVLGVVSPAHAATPIIRLQDGTACIRHPHVSYNKFACTRVSPKEIDPRYATSSRFNAVNPSSEKVASLNFTESDSDAAIAVFGCDCPYCQNALRALRGQAPMVY